MEPLRSTRTVTVVDVDPGAPPAVPPSITVAERLRGAGGRERSFAQEIRILDSRLFRQLHAEVKRGDEIEVAVVTEFLERGYVTYLAAYAIGKRGTGGGGIEGREE